MTEYFLRYSDVGLDGRSLPIAVRYFRVTSDEVGLLPENPRETDGNCPDEEFETYWSARREWFNRARQWVAENRGFEDASLDIGIVPREHVQRTYDQALLVVKTVGMELY